MNSINDLPQIEHFQKLGREALRCYEVQSNCFPDGKRCDTSRLD